MGKRLALSEEECVLWLDYVAMIQKKKSTICNYIVFISSFNHKILTLILNNIIHNSFLESGRC